MSANCEGKGLLEAEGVGEDVDMVSVVAGRRGLRNDQSYDNSSRRLNIESIDLVDNNIDDDSMMM